MEPLASVRHRATAGLWSEPLDLSPTWTTDVFAPTLVASRDGGLVLAVTRDSVGSRLTNVWRSPDGRDWENLGTVDVDYGSRTAKLVPPVCLSEIVLISEWWRTEPARLARYVGNFVTYESFFDQPESSLHETGSAAILSDGSMAWTYGYSNGAVTEFWLVMHATAVAR